MSKITESAKGEECTLRIPGVCNFNTETTVFAHRGGGGMGMKHKDLFGAYCCSSCHDVIDGKVKSYYTREQLLIFQYEAIFETQEILLRKGLVKI